MSDIYSQHRKAAKSAKNISVISQFSPPTYADSIRSKRPNVYTRRMWYNMGSILLCLAMRQHRKACNESTKETRHVSIISPYTILLPCKRCGQEKLHRSLGFNISTVCLDCLASLPDVPDGMKRCPTCLESKPFSAFHQNKGRCHGWCKQCKSDWLKERYDPDKKRDEN